MNFLDLSKRVAIVTGAAQGIGLAVSKRLAMANASVVLADIKLKEVKEVTNKMSSEGRKVMAVECDVSDPGSVKRLISSAIGAFQQVDILVNNAAIFPLVAPIEEQSDREWDKVMAVDLTGIFYCCRAVVPHMKKIGRGRIINLTSIGAKEGQPNMVPYCAAKGGIIGLTKALAKELAAYNILVNAVSPALIETPMIGNLDLTPYIARTPLGRVGQPEEVAAMVHWMASDDVSFSTGVVFDISGGRAMY